jgi:hypothetical protein
LGEIEDVVKQLLAQPENERLMIESAHSMKLPPKGELCTLSDLEIFYPRLKETLV